MTGFVIDACSAIPEYTAFWGDWKVGVGIALIIAAGMLALFYMAAKFFGNSQLEVWVRAEVGQLFITAAIAALAIVLVSWMCSFNPAVFDSLFGRTPGQYANLQYDGHDIKNFYDAANYYLEYLLALNHVAYQMLIMLFFAVNHTMNAQYFADPVGIGFTIQPLAGLAPFTQVIIIATQALTFSLLLVLIEMKVLQYMSIAALTYLFPFGVLLRAFEPTRMFGGSLIAFSLGMFIMYPALLVLNDYVVRTPQNVDWMNDVNEGMADVGAQADEQINLDEQRGSANNIAGGGASGEATGGQEIAGSTSNYIMPFLSGAMFIFISTVFLTAINFAILIAFIKELSTMLGEEMDISSITKMI